jgi:ribosome recycling factor
VVSRKVEDGHVAVRNVRRDSLETFRGLERSGDLSQDESRRAQNDLQQVTDSFIEQMDQLKREKEAEVMEV